MADQSRVTRLAISAWSSLLPVSPAAILLVILLITLGPGSIRAMDLLMYSTPSQHMYARPNVTPIGWSESGHFAVIVDRNLEGIGGTRHEYKIINAVTDQIVFEQAVDITAESLEQEDDPNAAKVKAEHQFAAARDQFGIQQGAGTDFHKLPVSVNDRRYSVDVRTTPQPDTEEWTPMDEIGSFEATVTAEGLGSKRITGSVDVRAYQVWPAGCFLSPFEPRMLVAIALEQYMFEGTEPAYVFSGAHLGVGYD